MCLIFNELTQCQDCIRQLCTHLKPFEYEMAQILVFYSSLEALADPRMQAMHAHLSSSSSEAVDLGGIKSRVNICKIHDANHKNTGSFGHWLKNYRCAQF